MKKAIVNLSPEKRNQYDAGKSAICRDYLVDQDYGVEIIHLYPNLKDLKPILETIRIPDNPHDRALLY